MQNLNDDNLYLNLCEILYASIEYNIWRDASKKYDINYRLSQFYKDQLDNFEFDNSAEINNSKQALMKYGLINSKLRKLKQNELSIIKLQRSITKKLIEIFELVGCRKKFQHLNEIELNLLLDLLDSRETDSENSLSPLKSVIKTQNIKTRNKLLDFKNELDKKSNLYLNQYNQHRISCNDEYEFYKFMKTFYTFISKSMAADNIQEGTYDENEYAITLMQDKLCNSIPLMSSLEPIIFKIFHQQSLSLDIIKSITTYICEKELTVFENVELSHFHYIPDYFKNNDIDFIYSANMINSLFGNSKPGLSGVLTMLGHLRLQHKQILDRVAIACEPTSPFQFKLR